MTLQDLKLILNQCIQILNIRYSIIGYSISLMDFLIFSLLTVLIFGAIFNLFHKS